MYYIVELFFYILSYFVTLSHDITCFQLNITITINFFIRGL